MSDSSSAEAAALDQYLAQTKTFDYADVAITALVVYEYLITLDQEVATVWKRKFSATSLLLLTTRCEATELVTIVLLALGYIQVALFSALRVFAIWNKNYVLAILVFLLSFVPVGADMFTWIHSSYSYLGDPVFGCTETLNYSDQLDIETLRIVTYLSRACLIAADTIVLVCTWVRTFQQWKQARRLDVSLSVSSCLLRDGTMYFALLLALSIIQIVTFSSTVAPLGPFITYIPPILVSRFIMNLRRASTTDSSTTTTTDVDASLPSALAFNRPPTTLIGNIGEYLEHGSRTATSVYSDSEMSGLDSDPEAEAEVPAEI